jgi:hypothetical protein
MDQKPNFLTKKNLMIYRLRITTTNRDADSSCGMTVDRPVHPFVSKYLDR